MQLFPLLSSLITLNFILQVQTLEICSSISCNHNNKLPIHFPFRVPENQTYRCGYPGFELSCNPNGQTILPLSSSSHLIIRGISYPDQLIWVSDPNNCIPKRVMNLPLTSTPFRFGPYENPYIFLNCSGRNKTKLEPNQVPMGASVISCMSEGNYTVVGTNDETIVEKMVNDKEEWKCEVMRRVNAAFWWADIGFGMFGMDISDVYLQLSWDVPNCGECSVRGGSCGLVGDYGLEVACFLPSSYGLSKGVKYGLILGAGIPGLLCIIGIAFYTISRVSARNQNRRYTNTGSSPSIFPQPVILTLGLDRPTIESYPKTILGESKRLPKPSDNTCPICLSEYQAKETLRSIPDCNHYFHADCIDEWLRLNSTCPLCRNSPQQSSALDGC